MDGYIPLINTALSFFTILGQVFIVLAVIFLIAKPKKNYFSVFSKNAVGLAFLIALSAVALSLFYSNVIGYEPCTLCWWQRIFMYPQMVLLGIAWARKDDISLYSLALAGIGGTIAAYQYIGQMFIPVALTCGAGESAAISCAKRFFVEFSYVTLPLMSFTAFLMIMVLMILYRKTHHAS